MQINVNFDQPTNTLPTGFVTAVNWAVDYLDSLFPNPVTLTINVGYGEVAGGSLGGALGGSVGIANTVSYTSVQNALLAQNAPGASTLPSSSPFSGSLYMPQAEAKALGLAAGTTLDGYVGFSNSVTWVFAPYVTPPPGAYDFIGVFAHEITEVMGRVSLINYQPSYYSLADLYRYTASGDRSLTTGGAGSLAYFSVDGGHTLLRSWNNDPSNGDLGDWYGFDAPGADMGNNYGTPGVTMPFSAVDLLEMQALGWTLDTAAPAAPTIAGFAADSGTVGDNITNDNTLTLTGTAEANSTIKVYDGATLLGSAAANGAGAWSYTTATLSNGAHSLTATANDAASNTSTASAALSVTIDRTAPVAPIITSDAVVNTTQVLLNGTAEANSTIKIYIGTTLLGSATANSSGAWTYTTASLSDGPHVFTATATDAAGNISVVSQPVDPITGTAIAIESNGSTSLTEIATHFYLDSISTLSLKYAGVDVVAGQFGTWAPIGAEKTATGYEIALKNGGADQYIIWNTDNNGNYVSSKTGLVSGSSYELQSLEPSFQQDLNHDGQVGLVTTVIETQGATDLTQAGGHYFLYDSVGSGPSLKYAGVDVVAGQFGTWAPIGAEKTATGYEIALKNGGADQYIIWNTDNNGNYVSSKTGLVSGSSYELQSLEPSFQQDLNHDGQVGLVTTVIETQGATDLTQAGGHYFLYDSVGSGPSLKYAGVDVVAGQFGTWAPIGAEKTATGYEIALKNGGADQYIIWNTDNNGNYVSSKTGLVSGSSYELQSLEPSFQQDLNHDGQVGLVTTVIETQGATDLTQAADHYFLYDSVGSGPSLKYAGVDVVAGQFGTWAPIGAEKTATGYEIALKNGGADQYIIWNTDNNGNYVSSKTGLVSGSSYELQSLEPSFQQDLNHDGQVGLVTTVIETQGATDLTQAADHYFLYDSVGSGPSLKYAGVDVVAGQFGTWTPIGAEKTATGYEIALKNGGADQYIIWNTDNNGNYVSSKTGLVSGSSYELQSLEPSFQQDLNHDGQVGLVTTVIETQGATDLTQAGGHYFLYDSVGSGPSLKYAGVDVVAGQFGTWTPIGAEKTATGYEIALKNGGADQYIIWNTDNNGNYVSSKTGLVSGSSYELQSLEPSFQQDLNHDGQVGLVTTVIETQGATDLTQAGGHYFLYDSVGSGPSLKYAGVDVVAGQFGTWAPIGAEKTATGYEIALKNGGADQYIIWNTDNNGNYVSSKTGLVSGSSYELQSLEPSFQQDLNHDGQVGLVTTVIETQGATDLTQAGGHYFLYDSVGSGPSLKYAGVDVVAGQFGTWAPIGAEKTATGYEIALKNGGADQYIIWNTDNNGNYVSSKTGLVSGSSYELQSLEPSFQQDLNHDGQVGPPTTVLDGHLGAQTLTASGGTTTLIGGPNDILNAGAGADTFVFGPGFGSNTINGFAAGTDAIQFDHTIFADVADVQSHMQQIGSDVVIAHDPQNVVTLHDVPLGNLHMSDFHIV